jgi:hypothetical protein
MAAAIVPACSISSASWATSPTIGAKRYNSGGGPDLRVNYDRSIDGAGRRRALARRGKCGLTWVDLLRSTRPRRRTRFTQDAPEPRAGPQFRLVVGSYPCRSLRPDIRVLDPKMSAFSARPTRQLGYAECGGHPKRHGDPTQPARFGGRWAGAGRTRSRPADRLGQDQPRPPRPISRCGV